MAVFERFDGGFNNIFWRPEIGLADAKIDDVLALPLQFCGASQHRKSVFLANA
jgi:hypothetical protein